MQIWEDNSKINLKRD